MKILICSDIHYASDLEKQRADYELRAIDGPLKRMLVRWYRRFIWLHDPFAHNHLLEHVLHPRVEPELVIANGDYSCDSGFIGVADAAARRSAAECLGKLRARYSNRFLGVLGDHEFGKVSLCGNQGGLRLASYRLAREELDLEPLWTLRLDRAVLIGVASSLLAMPVYERETLESERPEWRELAREHAREVGAAFEKLEPNDKVLLFCHDPTALPYLWEIPAVRARAPQLERTIIGHLHSQFFFVPSRVLAGMPRITFCGAAIRRMTAALARARDWRPFKVLLCPSLAGLEISRRGGFYMADIDPAGRAPARFSLQTIRR